MCNMKRSVVPSRHQVYVEMAPLTSHICPSNNVEDVHICGSCQRSFFDLNLFVEHKRAGCSRSAQETLPSTADSPFNSTSLRCVTANTSSANGDSIPSLESQYLRVSLDNDLHQGNQSQSQLSSTIRCSEEHRFLQARLLRVTEKESSVINHPTFENANEHTIVLEEQQEFSAKQREFQNDEEDVAALLANHLASEVVSSVSETNIPSKTGLITISHEFVPNSHNQFRLESINLCPDKGILKVNEKSCAEDNCLTRNFNANTDASEKLVLHTGDMCVKSGSIEPSPSCSGIRNTGAIKPRTSSFVMPSEDIATTNLSASKKIHKCTQKSCDFTTLYLKDLIRHERRHTGERPFKCYSCTRSFSRRDKLRLHERIHTGDKRYQCELCSYATHDGGSLRKHMRVHNDERPYKCQMCQYRSRDSSQLTVHLRTHTGDSPFFCTFESCTSAFKTSSDLKRHSRTHTGEKPFRCSFCRYKCAIKSNLSVHVRLAHSEVKAITCVLCNYIAPTKQEYKEHEKTHVGQIFECESCFYTCDSLRTMKIHCKTHDAVKTYSCKSCSFTSRRAAILNKHVKKKHSEAVRKKPTTTGKKRSSESTKSQRSSRSGSPKGSSHAKLFCVKTHKCTFCDAAYVREDSWRSHMRQHKKASKSPSSSIAFASGEKATTAESCNGDPMGESSSGSSSSRAKALSEFRSKNDVPTKSGSVIISTEYLTLSNNSDSMKENSKLSITTKSKKGLDNATNSGIENAFVEYSVESKSDEEHVPGVHHLSEEVVDADSLQNQPLVLYVQNTPVLYSGLDTNLCNAEIVASINQPTPILVTGCSQFLSVPLDHSASLEQFASTLPQGVQYLVSTPFNGVVGSNSSYIQPLEATDSSENELSVVTFQVEEGSALTTQEEGI